MKRIARVAVYFAVAMALPSMAQAAVVHTESFEAAPGGTYTLSSQFDDGGFDFFDRYAVPDNTNAARDDFQIGWDLLWGILGQDHDGDAPNVKTQVVTLPNVNVNGVANLVVTCALGALDSEAAGFNNYEAVDGDGFEIYAKLDANPRVLIGKFSPPAAGAGDLREDLNFDGVGTGTALTVALADFAFAIAGVGTSLTIEIEMTSTSSFEPLALDNVRVSGDGAVQVSESTWGALKALFR